MTWTNAIGNHFTGWQIERFDSNASESPNAPLTRVSPAGSCAHPSCLCRHKSHAEPRTEEKERDKKCYKFRREYHNGRLEKEERAIVRARNFRECTRIVNRNRRASCDLFSKENCSCRVVKSTGGVRPSVHNLVWNLFSNSWACRFDSGGSSSA